MLPSAPALVLPLWPSSRDRRDGALTMPREPSSVVVLLDRDVLAESVLPALVDLHLGAAPRDTQVWVIDRSRRDEMLFTTAPGSLPPPRHADDDASARSLLDLRFFPELRAQGFQHYFDDPDTRRQIAGAPGPRSSDGRGGPWGSGRRRHPAGRSRDRRRPAAARQRSTGPRISARSAPAAIRAPGRWSSLPRTARSMRPWRGSAGATSESVSRWWSCSARPSALLLVSARQAQRLARREMELVAGITHELRTPLASIASAADNLADGVVREPDQIRRYGGLIKGETHRLGTLVAQVLDFAGSAATARRARPVEPVDLGAVVDRVLDDHRFTIEEKGFVVEKKQPPHGVRALADPEALRRALDNVVGNALKYGDGGAVARHRDHATPPEHARTEDRVVLRVRDRGPGIARADRRRVFEPFYRGPASLHLHGTGLGLAVTRSVIESLGGTIEIEDGAGGRGATFAITLRAAPPQTVPEPVPAESAT